MIFLLGRFFFQNIHDISVLKDFDKVLAIWRNKFGKKENQRTNMIWYGMVNNCLPLVIWKLFEDKHF